MKFPTIDRLICLTMLTSSMLMLVTPSFAQSGPGGYGNVSRVYSCSRDGDPINLRARAGQQFQVVRRVPPGREVVLIGNTRVVGNYTWQKVNFYGAIGWVRGDFLCN
ncbi:SH3 domain-containing protein [Chamaesiphon sp.]|uniref:SH3 domain-containing protein n=1 Tax=Chamaesiphon sp. TaxID=2814140 RepID=UPI00359438F4